MQVPFTHTVSFAPHYNLVTAHCVIPVLRDEENPQDRRTRVALPKTVGQWSQDPNVGQLDSTSSCHPVDAHC